MVYMPRETNIPEFFPTRQGRPPTPSNVDFESGVSTPAATSVLTVAYIMGLIISHEDDIIVHEGDIVYASS